MKRIVKLKESDLHRIISESVKRVLSEGSKENNKPYFSKFYSSGHPTNKKARPGEKLYNGLEDNGEKSSWSDWDLRGNYTDDMKKSDDAVWDEFMDAVNDKDIERAKDVVAKHGSFTPNRDNLQNAMQKHNERARNNYMHNMGVGEENPKAHTLWGSKEQQDVSHEMDMKEKRKWVEMLKANGVSLREYNSMSEDEKAECWDYYRDWSSPRARRARMWDEMGDPNWDQIYDHLYPY